MFTYCLVIIAQNVVVSVQNSNATICVEVKLCLNEYIMMLLAPPSILNRQKTLPANIVHQPAHRQHTRQHTLL